MTQLRFHYWLPVILLSASVGTGCLAQERVPEKGTGMSQSKVRDGEFPLPDLSTLPPDGGPDYNRLIFSSSPYLLQHATNPVDWYPWGDEAFTKAVKEDKPIFLSIGYSTCHWCHVMEHESFKDRTVAEFLNEHFISIKLDREERPDVDHIYMTVCQALTGSGGWPLTLFMTPDKKPFFAGTYFPKDDRFGRPGFLRVIRALSDAWKNERGKIEKSGNQIIEYLNEPSPSAAKELSPSVCDTAVTHFTRSFDPEYGGFGKVPKFPMGHTLSYLLRRYERTKDRALLDMVEKTLTAMYRGGMYDHVGFGFCRYSTDERYLVPHFEKMLYDNALLLTAYTDAYQVTRNPFYAQVAREIVTYILRDMTAEHGGFYSAENADSEGEEGKFYVFTHDEFFRIIGTNAPIMAEYFGVTTQGNFEHGRNILHVASDPEQWRKRNMLSEEAAEKMIREAREKLFAFRFSRVHPSLDDKILSSWNGLMIASLARAGVALNEPSFTNAAQRAAHFLLTTMLQKDGTLLRRYRAGHAGIEGFLEDYAFVTWGLIELYQATFEESYLKHAVTLNATMLARFKDDTNGGLYFTSDSSEGLITRAKDAYDGAIPSGNGAAAWNLVRLARLTGDMRMEEEARKILFAFAGQIEVAPTGSTVLLTALDFMQGPSKEIILAAKSKVDLADFVSTLRSRFLPRAVVVIHPDGDSGKAIRTLCPYVTNNVSLDGKPTAYVCENFACKLPVTSVRELEEILK